jgi:hypothetical protein
LPVLPGQDAAVRVGRPLQRVGGVDPRGDGTGRPRRQHLGQLGGQQVGLVEQPADVHARDRLVGVHQPQRRDPGHGRGLPRDPQRMAALPAGQVGEAVADQAAAGAQQRQAGARVGAAQRVEHHVHALPVG